ncbi:hypothetical protein ENFAE_00450 [Enterococcus faecalis]|uniref:hypothetical protein n=1 Tax=Enterococcus faecalis TaxID=1351 RepID=UPI000878F482|nr:hypothetical protein [Enterococcus faecalis]EGO8395732.1 hypothetical protein [Enterococcus faecalis]EKZ0433849.1 hypothetical protein [Enterococcus faecalis]OFA14744.1 hypothetical protein ENFAE_00450 [Enterococcus faecalis]
MNKKYIVAIGAILLIVLTIIAFTVSNKTETQSQNTVQSTTTSQSSELVIYPSLSNLKEKYGPDLTDLGSSQITTVLFEKKNVAFITPKEGTDLEFSIKVTNTKENLFSIPDIQYTPSKLKIGDTFGLAKVNEQYFAYLLK